MTLPKWVESIPYVHGKSEADIALERYRKALAMAVEALEKMGTLNPQKISYPLAFGHAQEYARNALASIEKLGEK